MTILKIEKLKRGLSFVNHSLLFVTHSGVAKKSSSTAEFEDGKESPSLNVGLCID